MAEGEREVCQRCSAKGQDYCGQILFPLCKVIKLQLFLGRTPTGWDAKRAKVDVSNIPGNCPDGFVSPDSKPLR